MKHLFTSLLAWLLLAGPALAQTTSPVVVQPPTGSDPGDPTPTDPVRTKLDNIFAPLDKSQLGRLLEAAVPLGPVTSFNGTLRDSARADMDVFRHLYATALSSRVNGTEPLPDIPTFNQRVGAARRAAGSAIPIAVQYIRYAYLRPDAESAGLVRLQNEQLYDVPGRTQSPYLGAVLFAAAPERTYSPSNTVSLLLSTNLYMADGLPSAGKPTVSLDFGDGQGYRSAAWDQPLSTTYGTGGTKRVKVKLVYRVYGYYSEIRESWFDLTVAPPAPAATARYTTDITYSPNKGFIQFFGATTPSSPADYAHHLGATVNVRFGQGHTRITKPFIVVEGYNTAAIAPHLVGKNNLNNTVEEFLQKTDVDFATTGNFNDNLEQAGYDLIYIDFNYGTDDIRRNAKLFEEVLAWVNTQKQNAGSTEPNVVMGESMGGLVARYGLARLARSGYNPQTRLLILHDSPQRGANNPMGLQALTRQADFPIALLPGNNQGGTSGIVRTSDLNDKLKEALAILAAPATSQLSIKTVTGIDNEYQNNTFIDGPYKDMVDFGGNPPAIFPTIIATSDGSQCGRPQSTPVYQELTRNNRNYLLGSGAALFHLGVQTEAIVNGLPAYGTQNTIAHLRVWFTVRLLWLRVDINLLNRNYTSPANTLPYETLPGGTSNLNEQQDLTTNHANGFLGFWDFSDNTTLYNGNICFVPTYSALDVPTVTTATAYAKYVNNVTDNPSPPRVASYIAQENVTSTQFNQAHIRFTARNSEWIYNEMQRPFTGGSSYNNTVGCSTECLPLTINSSLASGRLCAGSSVTFSIPNLPAGTAVSWSTSPAGYFTPQTGSGPTFTTTATGQQGTATVTALVGACQVPITTRVGTGPAPIDGFYYCGSGCSSSTGPVQGQLSDFTIVPPGTYTLTLSTADNRRYGTWQGQVDGNNWYTYNNNVSAVVTLSAGQRAQFTVPFSGSSCGAGSGTFTLAVYSSYRLVATPNPASSDLFVTAVDGDQPETSTTPSATPPPFEVELYDSRGKKVKARKSDKGKAQIDVRELPAGLYNVRAGKGKEAISKHIEITH